jgi:3-dehydroquinate synthase
VHTAYAAAELFEHALSDKKRSGGTVNLILPRRIGHCDIVATPVAQLLTLIEEGM